MIPDIASSSGKVPPAYQPPSRQGYQSSSDRPHPGGGSADVGAGMIGRSASRVLSNVSRILSRIEETSLSLMSNSPPRIPDLMIPSRTALRATSDSRTNLTSDNGDTSPAIETGTRSLFPAISSRRPSSLALPCNALIGNALPCNALTGNALPCNARPSGSSWGGTRR